MTMIQFQNGEARRIFSQVCEELQGLQKEKFKEALAKRFDEKITGEDQRFFKITTEDILEVARALKLVGAPKIITKR